MPRCSRSARGRARSSASSSPDSWDWPRPPDLPRERATDTLPPVVAPVEGVRARRWPRRLLIALCIIMTLSTLAVASGYVYLRWRFDQIKKIDFGSSIDPDRDNGPMNVLLVGSDSRARLSGGLAQAAGKGQVSGERSDTVMILHADPREKKAAILSIPRDLSVRIAGTNQTDRINAAFATGGPA